MHFSPTSKLGYLSFKVNPTSGFQSTADSLSVTKNGALSHKNYRNY